MSSTFQTLSGENLRITLIHILFDDLLLRLNRRVDEITLKAQSTIAGLPATLDSVQRIATIYRPEALTALAYQFFLALFVAAVAVRLIWAI